MINLGKYPILGINVHAVDYDFVVDTVVSAAKSRQPCAVSPLAVHGVMTGLMDPVHARRLNGLDLVVPDGQPVRWALSWLHDQHIPDRVCGPELTLRIAEAFSKFDLKLYLYGSRQDVLTSLSANLKQQFPNLQIVGMEPSKFRKLTDQEFTELIERIQESGANAVFVGLGCPRQEVLAYELRNFLNMPILAIGAAFDFHAGFLRRPSIKIQNMGLEWLYRLIQEPKRLWYRYLVLGSLYLWNVSLQYFKLKHFEPLCPDGNEKLELFG
jgi:exopolysaccharide biosynthesis WecB/TagA/CpsF family protein